MIFFAIWTTGLDLVLYEDGWVFLGLSIAGYSLIVLVLLGTFMGWRMGKGATKLAVLSDFSIPKIATSPWATSISLMPAAGLLIFFAIMIFLVFILESFAQFPSMELFFVESFTWIDRRMSSLELTNATLFVTSLVVIWIVIIAVLTVIVLFVAFGLARIVGQLARLQFWLAGYHRPDSIAQKRLLRLRMWLATFALTAFAIVFSLGLVWLFIEFIVYGEFAIFSDSVRREIASFQRDMERDPEIWLVFFLLFLATILQIITYSTIATYISISTLWAGHYKDRIPEKIQTTSYKRRVAGSAISIAILVVSIGWYEAHYSFTDSIPFAGPDYQVSLTCNDNRASLPLPEFGRGFPDTHNQTIIVNEESGRVGFDTHSIVAVYANLDKGVSARFNGRYISDYNNFAPEEAAFFVPKGRGFAGRLNSASHVHNLSEDQRDSGEFADSEFSAIIERRCLHPTQSLQIEGTSRKYELIELTPSRTANGLTVWSTDVSFSSDLTLVDVPRLDIHFLFFSGVEYRDLNIDANLRITGTAQGETYDLRNARSDTIVQTKVGFWSLKENYREFSDAYNGMSFRPNLPEIGGEHLTFRVFEIAEDAQNELGALPVSELPKISLVLSLR
ncbi:MAG: hypothetical protein R8G34_02820 [Paracoccaceae bacterium]|nr:hypothetical protein [Paracoccaceae bacterium]